VTFPTPSIPYSATAYTITYSYAGDSNFTSASDSSKTLTVNKATPPVTTWPTASAIAYGQTLASSTLSGGAASVAGTFAWTTATTAPGAGTAAQSVTFTPTDTTNYNPATGTVSVTVNKAAASLTLSSSINLALVGNAVTFTATAPSKATGTVDFYDGSTRLASVTLSQGAAAYTTSSLAAGTHSITASYTGDSNFLSATSPAVSQVVTDYTVTRSPTRPRAAGSRSATATASGCRAAARTPPSTCTEAWAWRPVCRASTPRA
jgi:hypothetical protein